MTEARQSELAIQAGVYGAELYSENQQLRAALTAAISALEEAEAILGGEYGDHYGVLCELMMDLKAKAGAALSSTAPQQERSAPTSPPAEQSSSAVKALP